MNPKLTALIFLFILAYLIYSIKITILIIKTPILTRKYKIINSILTWFIPFLWGALIKGNIEITNPKRRRKKRRSSGSGSLGGTNGFDTACGGGCGAGGCGGI